MIHTTTEEIRIIVYLIGYGIFMLSTYDALYYLIKKIKKTFSIFVQVIYGILMIYVAYKFSYQLAYGYIPIHYILFLTIGFVIYQLIRKPFLIGIEVVCFIAKKIKKMLIEIMIFLVYPKEIIDIIKVPLKYIGNTIKEFIKVFKAKNKKTE